MSKRDEQVLKPVNEKQPSLFNVETKGKRLDTRIANLILRRLGLPADTVIFKHKSTYYYYVDNESVMAIDLSKLIRSKGFANASQPLLPYFYVGHLDSGHDKTPANTKKPVPPKRAEKLLLLILDKKGREYLVGDLAEEYTEIAAKQGERFAKVWYYKQVAASAWPMIRKGVRWGLIASVGEWIRRII
ncbi:MAG: hypothetical protein QOG71_2237 [Pyrinomonadaceae bacterium]|nr:hypothetical protein [Pyrinomonadaceae bacterium]